MARSLGVLTIRQVRPIPFVMGVLTIAIKRVVD